MLLPRKDAQNDQNAIDRRLVETLVSGGVRPFRREAPGRRAQVAGTGLFLVKPAMARVGMETTTQSEKMFLPPVATLRANPARVAQRRGGPAQVIRMPQKDKQARQERILGWMAAAGPLLWLSHALLVWLKIV